MKNFSIIPLPGLIVLVFPIFPVSASSSEITESSKDNLPEVITIRASTKETPPSWAVMQRQLIKSMEDAVPYYLNHFTQRDGTLYGKGPWDDVAEMFYNWSLFYGIGADEKLFTTALMEYNALIRQCTYQDDQLYREFTKSDDWFHISEGLMAFYDLALGDPTIPENIARAKRFAGFYMNEDPESTRNYDPVNKPTYALPWKG